LPASTRNCVLENDIVEEANRNAVSTMNIAEAAIYVLCHNRYLQQY